MSLDKRDELKDLIKKAAAKDAIKDYNTASDLYSQATEIQAELNGELSPENADLLYSYGKSLFNVAVSKSDVLGSKVAGEPQTPSNHPEPAISGESTIKDAISSARSKNFPSTKEEDTSNAGPSKPLFQFTGDENFADSNSEDEDNSDTGEEEEEEDDFSNAFEVLDLARVLYLKKLEIAEANTSTKDKSTSLPSDTNHIKERLADTYDLQAEISLEAERFSDAVTDLRTALDLRYSLFPFEDPAVAECHYKLSLALEFASVQQQEGDDDESKKTVDEKMRNEAVSQMERAVESCKVRMAQEEKKISSEDMDEDKATAAKRKIVNVKEIIADMEQRLIDLQAPVSSQDNDKQNEAFLKGILGQMVGQTPADKKASLDAVSKNATDLSSLVRRKPTNPSPSTASSKRPADNLPSESDAKRTRVNGNSSHS
ncbi:hypothetical protein N7495_006129 [Penicillium taxi]|uniref:uncharacterized protein n=1 Tax=Penicillium taxi TaxID=168475 RepID=UPI00254501F6|nr:uncharacterized protein N7495_006129 [Penicillium taxi]KAJ5894438.1 hypothetical protein N7495_006129 [Penicillium taxi]